MYIPELKPSVKQVVIFVAESKIVIILSAVLLAIGITALVSELTWFEFPAAFSEVPVDPCCKALNATAFWCVLGGSFTGILALIQLKLNRPKAEAEGYSKQMFGRCLVGIGFVLLLDALVNVVAVAGLARAGAVLYLFEAGSIDMLVTATNDLPTRIDLTLPGPLILGASNSPSAYATLTINSSSVMNTNQYKLQPSPLTKLKSSQVHLVNAVQLLFALGFTVMGALFFFAKSLWGKMKTVPTVAFDERIFWAGLWFRLGAAIVFTVVIFLALLCKHYDGLLSLMPFIALMMGLNVKTAENLIAGLSQRFLDSINALVGKG